MISIGSGTELNPLFYSFGVTVFSFFGYAFLVVAYLIIWFVDMPSTVRWSLMIVLTVMTAFDFTHDFILMEYHRTMIPEFWRFLKRELVR